jgi:hypothetical protein
MGRRILKMKEYKIRDDELLRFAKGEHDDATMSVIIEVVPILQTKVKIRDGKVREVVGARSGPRISNMDDFQRELDNFNLDKLVRLNAAHAFAATVNPEQLQEISCLSKTLRIYPNRKVQVIQPI